MSGVVNDAVRNAPAGSAHGAPDWRTDADPIDQYAAPGVDVEQVIDVLRQLQRGMRCTIVQRDAVEAAIRAVQTVRATRAELERVRLVVDELGAYCQLAGEADQLLAKARAAGGDLGRRMRREAAVKATLAGAAATAAMVQQSREGTAQLAGLLEADLRRERDQ